MKTEKFKKISTIIVSIIVGLVFLADAPLKYILLRYFYVYPTEFFVFSFCSSLLIGLLIITRKYFSVANVFKAFGIMLVFLSVEIIAVIDLNIGILALIYQFARPLLVFAVIILLFFWISKCRIAKDKTLFSLIGIAYGAGAILNISEYLSFLQYSSGLAANGFFGYLNLLDSSNNINSFFSSIFFYAQILLLFLLLIKSLALYGKEPKKKNDEISEKDDTDFLTAVEGETWKCMGCGQLVSVGNDRCSCGYKK